MTESSQVRFPGGAEMDGQSPLIPAPCPPTGECAPGAIRGLCPISQDWWGGEVTAISKNLSFVSSKLIRRRYWLPIASLEHAQIIVNLAVIDLRNAVVSALRSQLRQWRQMSSLLSSVPLSTKQ